MTEIVETYLGNCHNDPQLQSRLAEESYLEVYLTPADNRKSRIFCQANAGIELGIIKNRAESLREGDIFATATGRLVFIHLQAQKVMVLSLHAVAANQAQKLLHLGHVLGNHHWPILVLGEKIYLDLVVDEQVIEATIKQFQIPGLEVGYEWRSPAEALTFSAAH
jgi:urease accessory protein